MVAERTDLRFVVTVKPSGVSEVVIAEARPVCIRYDQGTLKVLNVQEDDRDRSELADMVVGAQCSRTEDDRLQGFHMGYAHVWWADLERLEPMTKLAKRIKTRLLRMEHELGNTESFAQYLARIAVIVGISQFGILKRDGEGRKGYSPTDYAWSDASDLGTRIAAELREVRRGTRPEGDTAEVHVATPVVTSSSGQGVTVNPLDDEA